jgi:hypothetical protein
MFGQRPSALAGILDESVALDFDMAAWYVLSEADAEAARRAQAEAEGKTYV